jgi:hypothetical protein
MVPPARRETSISIGRTEVMRGTDAFGRVRCQPARRPVVHVEYIHTVMAVSFLAVLALVSQIVMRPRT